MYCPKCQQQQPDGSTECSHCGIVFARWQKIQQRAAAAGASAAPFRSDTIPRRVGEESGQDSSKGLTLSLKILALLLIGAGWLWFFFWTPAGLPVPQNAYRDDKNGFALMQPQGWKLQPMRDCKSSGALLGLKKDICNVLQLEEEHAASQSRPNIQVLVAPVSSMFRTGFGGSVSIGKDNMEEIAKALETGISGSLPGFTTDSTELVAVDNLVGVKLTGSAELKGRPMQIGDKTVIVPFSDKSQQSIKAFLGGMILVGGSTCYCIMFGSDSASFDRCASIFNQVINSFRITQRHATPFQKYGGFMGSIIGDAILGLLVGLTIGLFKIL
jgi:hypothetical protein